MKISKQSVEYVNHMGDDLSVVNAARVSFAKESDWGMDVDCMGAPSGYPFLKEQDQKLINYLAKHNHWSPFAHTSISFRIKAPIFVARQLVKHQIGLTWNEVSRRYVDDEPEFYFPDVWRGRPVNAKQGSNGVVLLEEHLSEDPEFGDYWPTEIARCALSCYQGLLGAGVAPEQARMVLPQNTMTEWIWTGSLMAFARVCKLRLDPHAQQETQEVAAFIAGYCSNLFPHSWKALME